MYRENFGGAGWHREEVFSKPHVTSLTSACSSRMPAKATTAWQRFLYLYFGHSSIYTPFEFSSRSRADLVSNERASGGRTLGFCFSLTARRAKELRNMCIRKRPGTRFS